MNDKRPYQWNPQSVESLRDQHTNYDRMRETCPTAHSELLGWSLFRHEDIAKVLHNPETFSNAVSSHLSVPNGMDPPEHTAYRRIIDKYFTKARMDPYEPVCRTLTTALVRDAAKKGTVEFVATVALPFAVKNQCAFLKWPESLHDQLVNWTQRNHEATRKQDRPALSAIAREFEELIDNLIDLKERKKAKPGEDIVSSLLQEKIWGRTLSNEEISSILRNWTVGEIGTIAASVSIMVHFLSENKDIQALLRNDFSLLPRAIDEILRIQGPLVANRRITTSPIELAGWKFNAGERLSLTWISANRDPRVFNEPDKFRLDRDASKNLLYGTGIHECPGAPLARLEMRVFMEELLRHTKDIQPVSGDLPVKASYPASGFTYLPLKLL